MIYAQPKRLYRNERTGATSERLADVVGDTATLVPGFSVGVRRGTWKGSPFREVENIPRPMPPEVTNLEPAGPVGSVELDDAPVFLFNAVCDIIRRSWRADKFHVVFHSSGYDSRIISGAIRQLYRDEKFNFGRGVLFLSNRWEAELFYEIMHRTGWPSETIAAYDQGEEDDHFSSALNFDFVWHVSNAPVPIPGNLWWYLVDWAQSGPLPVNHSEMQGFSGLWANETWRCFSMPNGTDAWCHRVENWYSYNAMAALPCKIPTMEYPLTDVDVLSLLPTIKDADGDRLRRAVADYACPEAVDVPRLALDDRGHPISARLRDYCRQAYSGSWYGRNVRKDWRCPSTSEFANEWGWYGLASLCEELRRRGVDVRV